MPGLGGNGSDSTSTTTNAAPYKWSTLTSATHSSSRYQNLYTDTLLTAGNTSSTHNCLNDSSAHFRTRQQFIYNAIQYSTTGGRCSPRDKDPSLNDSISTVCAAVSLQSLPQHTVILSLSPCLFPSILSPISPWVMRLSWSTPS